ncbi:MAG TPA: hypothetical protein DCF68_12185, partial [Cyanothece sp. UBA12306]|nr:hypothetical protein [Cyanothece sp. UBA12306]
LFFSLIVLVILAIPLGFSLEDILLRAKVRQSISRLRRTRSQLVRGSVRSIIVKIRPSKQFAGDLIEIQMEVAAPKGRISQEEVVFAQNFLSNALKQPVKLRVNVINLDVFE